jgi:hypothetical protein
MKYRNLGRTGIKVSPYAVGEVERVAVDGDISDDRMPERLAEHGNRLHVVAVPQTGELRAA